MGRTLRATVVLFTASQVAIAAPRYTKKEADIQAAQTAVTKPTQKKVEEKKKPDITAEDIFSGMGEKVKLMTDQQIKVLQKLVATTPDTDPERPDYLFRLAEHYAENQRFYNFKARSLDEPMFKAQGAGDTAKAGQLKKQQDDALKRENQWLLAAVKQYLEVADHPEKYRSYKRMDEVLFYLAYLLTQVKKEEAARKYFKVLIKDYPKSKYIADAYFAFAEYYFDNKDLENALKLYEQVLKYPKSRVYIYARYKEGWVYYNLSDFKQALATFVDVINIAQKGQGEVSKVGRITVEKEAKKDCVRAYARLPNAQPEKAWPFFQRIGGDYAPTMMEQLAELYNAQGQFVEAIKVLRQMISLNPNSDKLCVWQNEIVRNTLSMTGSRDTPETVKEMQRLAEVYEKRFKDNKTAKQTVVDECRENTANTLRELATVWHKTAYKTNNKDTFDLAQYLYKEYLNKFPKEKDVYVMTYYYAELLYKLGMLGANQKFCDAAPVYTQVVQMDPAPTSKYLKDAAYASVVSWKNCLEVDDSAADVAEARKQQMSRTQKGKKEEKSAEQVFAPMAIPDREQKMIDAFDTYIKYVPDSKELVTIKYRKARIYYERNHFDEAVPLFREIAEKHQDSDLAVFSANLLFDSLAIKKSFKELDGAVEVFCNSKLIEKDSQFKDQCGVIKCSTFRKRIEVVEKENRYKEAGELYLKLPQICPNDQRLAEVYWNAGVNFEKAKLVGLAIQARNLLIEKFPEHEKAKRALFLIGRNYKDVAAFEAASDNFEKFASKFPGEKEAPEALYTASFFRRGLGDTDLAIKDTDLYVQKFGPRKDFTEKAGAVKFAEYLIYEQQKDHNKLKSHFANYIKNWGSKGGVDRLVMAHVKLGEILWKESCPVPGVNGACIDIKRERAGGAARVAKKGKKKGKKGIQLSAQCGPETKSKITVHSRGPKASTEAMTHFKTALQLARTGASKISGKDKAETDQRVSDMAYAAAQARMMQADAEYEKFLGMKIPEKLDFTAKKQKESQTKFKAFLDQKGKQLEVASKAYQSVIVEFKVAHWAIAASARIGQLYQDFSGQLFTAPVPKLPTPPGVDPSEYAQLFHDAYCDQLVDAAEPIETKAVQGLGACLNKSTELSWFNEWSALCESELNQIDPRNYALATEIRAEPGYYSVAPARETVMPLVESK